MPFVNIRILEGHPQERKDEIASGLESTLGCLLQATAHQPIEHRRNAPASGGKVRRMVLQDRV